MELARAYGDDEFMTYAELHADIIRRFGRFPHRNAMLGTGDDAGGAGLSTPAASPGENERRALTRICRTSAAHDTLHCGSA